MYNEKPNIGFLKKDLESTVFRDHRFYLFVDDCSDDGTVDAIHDCFRHSDYHVIEKAKNEGPGDSFNLGLHWILEHSRSDEDLVVTLEGDNTSDLTTLPSMLAISQLGFDLVLASVYAQGGSLDQTNLYRKLLSFSANILLRTTLDLKISTISSFYRIYRKPLLRTLSEKYQGQIIEEKGFISMVEILVKAIEAGARVIEVPTKLLSEKRKGASKMNVQKTLAEYIGFILKWRSLHFSYQKKQLPY